MTQSLFPTLELDNRLLQALEKLAFTTPTSVQTAAVPPALAGKDLLVGAATGSGKTVAFLLPTMQCLLEKSAEAGRRDCSGTRALILVPTRELAIQVVKDCDKLASCSHLKTGLIVGGNSFKFQQALLRKNPEIIVATPGRLIEHIEQGSTDFNDLEVLVLDEADRMLDMGLSEDVLNIAHNCKKERQTLLFSATLNHNAFSAIAENILHEPEVIKLNTVRESRENIRQQIVLADDVAHKDKLTSRLLENETFSKALIFTNKRTEASRLCGLLSYQKQRAGVLHGDMSQDDRRRVMSQFRGGSIDILVATDVAARGLDIDGIDLVINYDMPRSGTDYIHRIGRTGRAENDGLAISLTSASEWGLMSSIERYLKANFERRKLQGLEGRYKGPKKLKKSGKAAGSKLKKNKKNADDKTKGRHRDKKNIGKRRKTSASKSSTVAGDDGHSPPKKRKVIDSTKL